MRILQLTPHYQPDIGGVERHVQAISTGLARRGHQVTVATMRADIRRPTADHRDGVRVLRFPSVGVGAAYRVPPRLLFYLRRAGEAFDIVHAHNYHAPLTPLAAALTPERLIVTPHLNDRPHSRFARVLHRPYAVIGGASLRRAQTVICVSQAERDRLIERFRTPVERLIVAPNGVDTTCFGGRPERATRDPRLLLVVGRLQAYKRVERIIAALAYAPPDYHLTIVGDGPERPRLEGDARARGVADRVTFTGAVSDTRLAEWYARASVLVNVSEAEAFGVTIIEALASGCQVVCSAIPAFRDLADRFPRSVSLVGDDAPQALAAATRAASQRAPVSEDLSAFSWDAVVTRLEGIYADLHDRSLALVHGAV